MKLSRNNLYLALIGIVFVGILSTVTLFSSFLNSTPYDLSFQFNEEEYSVEFSVVNGYTESLEIIIPENTIDIVYGLEVNGKNFDDNKRVILDGNRIFIDYGDEIKTVKLLGARDMLSDKTN